MKLSDNKKLEEMIDKNDLLSVLQEIADICYQKAENEAEHKDYIPAQQWKENAIMVDETAQNINTIERR